MLLILIESGTISLGDVGWEMGQASRGHDTAADNCELDKAVPHEATEWEHLIRM